MNLFRRRTAAADAPQDDQAPALQPVPAPAEIPLPAHLEAVRAAQRRLAAVREEIAAIERQVDAANAAAQPSLAVGSQAQSLRQQRSAIYDRMLLAGVVDTADPELRAIEQQLLESEGVERQAAAVDAAHQARVADLRERQRVLVQQLPELARELAFARFAAATTEIETELKPQFLQAARLFGSVLAQLEGAGVAHHRLAQTLRDQYGSSPGALGSQQPYRTVAFGPVGFGFHDGDYNRVLIDIGPEIDAASNAALSHWTSEGE